MQNFVLVFYSCHFNFHDNLCILQNFHIHPYLRFFGLGYFLCQMLLTNSLQDWLIFCNSSSSFCVHFFGTSYVWKDSKKQELKRRVKNESGMPKEKVSVLTMIVRNKADLRHSFQGIAREACLGKLTHLCGLHFVLFHGFNEFQQPQKMCSER